MCPVSKQAKTPASDPCTPAVASLAGTSLPYLRVERERAERYQQKLARRVRACLQ